MGQIVVRVGILDEGKLGLVMEKNGFLYPTVNTGLPVNLCQCLLSKPCVLFQMCASLL